MKNVISVENMRKSDASTIESGRKARDLMYDAALGVFNNVNWTNDIGIVCGKGNNAGDGYCLGLILNEHGFNVTIVLATSSFSRDGEYYFNKVKEANIKVVNINEINSLSNFNIVVDALLGTGFKGELSPELKKAITMINESKAYVVSIDINSGLNGDNGLTSLAVKSNKTISIGQYKFGQFVNSALDYYDELINVEIGIEPLQKEGILLEDKDVKKIFPPRKHFSNKGTYGYVGILGGSSRYPGAIKLASLGQNALYAGAGVSKLIVPSSIAVQLYPHVLETTVYPMSTSKDGNMVFNQADLIEATSNLKSLALGVGLGESKENYKIIEWVLNNLQIPLIIDADGLNILSNMDYELLNKTKCKVILTPHLKEFSRLLKIDVRQVEENLVPSIKNFVNKYNVTLLVKGPSTIIADKEKMYVVNKGTPGMATGGSGDVLTGILVGILGQNSKDVTFSIACGAYINGLAGEIASSEFGEVGMVASDTVRSVSKAIKYIQEKS